MANEPPVPPETARQDLADGFDAWQRHFSDGLQRMQRSGELRQEADTDDPATCLFASTRVTNCRRIVRYGSALHRGRGRQATR
ncbi:MULTISPECIES: hypothetical protein [Nocardiaceae]|jgi:hypothetical protein|uniref:hypothetical protein n=1 Tax=Nocardiaceae TaxID=85025 RepID=UPI0026B1C579